MAESTNKLQSLEMLNSSSSGYDEINRETLSEKNYLGSLHLFLSGANTKLNNYLQEHPHLVDTSKHKALFLLNLIILGQKLKPQHISVREPNPKLVDEFAYQLIELYKDIVSIFKFQEIDFYQYKDLMPSIVIYWSDYLLGSQTQSKVYNEISNDSNFVNLVDDNLRAQQYRLFALYYRRQGDNKKAEELITKYRESFTPTNGTDYKLNKLKPSKIYPAKQVLKKLPEIYKEVTEIQEEVLTRSGVYKDTCFYYQCTDCCKKDFPVVSLAEFLHIKNSLSKPELEKFTKRAKAIQQKHIELYGEPLKIIDQTIGNSKEKLNPHGMQFTCPFLSESDACEIHSLRPLACRAFGLSTIDDSTVQACKYYLKQYQYNSSQRNERDVYDSRPHTAMIGAANTILAQEHGYKNMKQPVGSLVAWLTAESRQK